MTTHENAAPPPDWRPEPRPCPIFLLVPRLRPDEQDVPPNITLGEN